MQYLSPKSKLFWPVAVVAICLVFSFLLLALLVSPQLLGKMVAARKELLVSLLFILVSLSFAVLFGNYLQKTIRRPVSLLADATRGIIEEGDYSARLEVCKEGEVGQIAARFNLLLEVIELRNEQLNEHQQNLESQLRERTEQVLQRCDAALAAAEDKIALLEKSIAEGGVPETGKNRSVAAAIEGLGKALLVDDEPINRKVLGALLQELGIETEVADNGGEALQLIAQKDYSFVLMDVHMPEMDGLEATRRIRALEKKSPARRRAMVIAMTANNDEDTLNNCRAAGMDDLLIKPIELQKLLESIIGCFEQDSLYEESPAVLVLAEESRPPTKQKLWHRNKALEFVGGDESLLAEIAAVFVERNDLLLSNIATAIDQGNGAKLLEAAHAYKGAVSHFASPVLRQLAMALEKMAANGNITGADFYLAQLRDGSRLLCNALSKQLNGKEVG